MCDRVFTGCDVGLGLIKDSLFLFCGLDLVISISALAGWLYGEWFLTAFLDARFLFAGWRRGVWAADGWLIDVECGF